MKGDRWKNRVPSNKGGRETSNCIGTLNETKYFTLTFTVNSTGPF